MPTTTPDADRLVHGLRKEVADLRARLARNPDRPELLERLSAARRLVRGLRLHDPRSFEVGDQVQVSSRGRLFKGEVVKVGRARVTVNFRWAPQYAPTLEDLLTRAEYPQALVLWEFNEGSV